MLPPFPCGPTWIAWATRRRAGTRASTGARAMTSSNVPGSNCRTRLRPAARSSVWSAGAWAVSMPASWPSRCLTRSAALSRWERRSPDRPEAPTPGAFTNSRVAGCPSRVAPIRFVGRTARAYHVGLFAQRRHRGLAGEFAGTRRRPAAYRKHRGASQPYRIGAEPERLVGDSRSPGPARRPMETIPAQTRDTRTYLSGPRSLRCVIPPGPDATGCSWRSRS
jgi:hypothetical protein